MIISKRKNRIADGLRSEGTAKAGVDEDRKKVERRMKERKENKVGNKINEIRGSYFDF